MKKMMIVLMMALSLGAYSLIGCGGGGGGAEATAPSVVNTTGGNNGLLDGGAGVTSVPGIEVVNGKIVVQVENGTISINGDNLTLTQQVNGEWVLIDGITITLTDQDGNVISGSVIVDSVTGAISFIPASGLEVDKTYTLTVTVGGVEYTATVIVAVDDTSEENSMFAGVTVHQELGTYNVSDLLVNGKAIFGWEFPPRFRIALSNLEEGASVTLTFYGIYNVEAYKDLVFFQRWEGSFIFGSYNVSAGDAVKDFPWYGTGGYNNAIGVNEQDSSIDGPDGSPDYSFWRTYAEMKITLNGEDITATSGAKVVITAY